MLPMYRVIGPEAKRTRVISPRSIKDRVKKKKKNHSLQTVTYSYGLYKVTTNTK